MISGHAGHRLRGHELLHGALQDLLGRRTGWLGRQRNLKRIPSYYIILTTYYIVFCVSSQITLRGLFLDSQPGADLAGVPAGPALPRLPPLSLLLRNSLGMSGCHFVGQCVYY